jgi:peptidoglycan/xylan/chitin deacetylase (PgdA/CDA1 family)
MFLPCVEVFDRSSGIRKRTLPASAAVECNCDLVSNLSAAARQARMYSRFKAYLFLTVLVFTVIGVLAWFESRLAPTAETPAPAPVHGESASDDVNRLISATAERPTDATAAASALIPPVVASEIPDNWRDDLGVPVLCYHQIVTEAQYRERPTPYAVTVAQFKAQMQWLAEHNFYTVLPDELLAYVKGEKKLDFSNGRRPIMITFDDGNNDFVHHAQKVLDEHKFKGVLYIYPTYILARKQRSMTWAEIQAVRKAGHAIESHTMWHPMLSTMTEKEQRAQFVDSKKMLDQKGGANVRHLAYPFGIYNASSIKLLREAGYLTAGTTFHGANQIGEPPYLLRRYLIVKGDNEKIFAQKTLARSLPLRLLNSEPGAFISGETEVALRIPAGLDRNGFRVRVFSTPQSFTYDAKTGNMNVTVKPSKKRLSVLEILYKEKGIEYRANALFNHRRTASGDGEEPKPLKKKKRLKNQKKKRNSDNE